mmetsp:Transcript_18367/g.45091  ORF Transcript_18367/g.45091 Transcript_18367/m.45091 type:complete len:205 (+) Transcript_18367:446-1060(+)
MYLQPSAFTIYRSHVHLNNSPFFTNSIILSSPSLNLSLSFTSKHVSPSCQGTLQRTHQISLHAVQGQRKRASLGSGGFGMRVLRCCRTELTTSAEAFVICLNSSQSLNPPNPPACCRINLHSRGVSPFIRRSSPYFRVMNISTEGSGSLGLGKSTMTEFGQSGVWQLNSFASLSLRMLSASIAMYFLTSCSPKTRPKSVWGIGS